MRRRRLLGIAARFILLPALLLGAIELSLVVFGVGYPTTFYLRDNLDGQVVVRENPEFTLSYFPKALVRRPEPFVIPLEKPADTVRIFVFGASAALGDPEPAFSMGRMLEVMLDEAVPDLRFEVVNTAITATNSHVLVATADDVTGLSPDLYLVYVGNNEVIGPYGPGTVFGPIHESRAGVRASIWFAETRIGQLLRSWTNQAPRETWGGLAMFESHRITRDDPRLQRTYRQYEGNLRAVCGSAADAGARVLLCTVASNLADQPPFAGEAANAEFRAGRRHLAANESVEAARVLTEARDLDELRFRADSRLNQIVRELAIELDEAELVDIDQLLRHRDRHGAPGMEWFYEHVHFNFVGNYFVARQLFDAVVGELRGQDRIEAAGPPPSADRVRAVLGYTLFDQMSILDSMRERFSVPPFEQLEGMAQLRAAVTARHGALLQQLQAEGVAERVQGDYRAALRDRPDDWYLLRNAGRFAMVAGDTATAVRYFEAAVARHPEVPDTRCRLGQALLQAGRLADGERVLSTLATEQPDSMPVMYPLLGELAVHNNQPELAIHYYEEAIRLNPLHAGAWLEIAAIQLSRGELEAADAAVAGAIAIQPGNPQGHFSAGLTYIRHGQRERARACFTEARRLDPGNADYRSALEQLGRR